ncbi:ShlB/FhaC/HecB family hemolysin secretion/activation protein [Anabaenopsis arnoldii]|uniref:ShlB/FhaC/HecB family hemolysin secretion/activation protein n=1 Tax=Anabaenopsis arnoldii TaxID=2152938 RepID=A0ABT5ARW2_9CYAN|nr:ShlB/FhaC/HecB family hemolysin secretion/activation protein [Anabaenopsis arnoldii]MDB9540053.1 ShlB/FhaC/HecB family hemolysin secretion/activation protein [Anabaenopsis arnoldii]MDH6092413.1 ShlB/FhaC/HecB family hemolysin secretion/activation protein [Anabaenopsis arnoldii]
MAPVLKQTLKDVENCKGVFCQIKRGWLGRICCSIFFVVLTNPAYAKTYEQMMTPIAGRPDIITQESTLETHPPPTNTAPLEAIPSQFKVQGFEFLGNTAFSDEKLRAEIQDFLDQKITFADLLTVESRLNKFYVDNGFVNSGVVIETQNLSAQGAVVKVTIIEGGIEDIKVRGTQRLRPEYIRSRLALAAQTPLNQNRILEALQLLKLDPQIQNISAQLTPGVRPDLSLLEVTVTEADTFHIDIFTNNGRSPSVGTWRRGIKINQGNVSGDGDSLTVSYANTDGSNVIDLSYTIPLNPSNGKLRLASGLTRTNVTEPPFDRLDITGDSSYYEAGLSQPLFQTPNQEFGLSVIFSHQHSQTKLEAEGFPISRGANNDGKTRISKIAFSQNWLTRKPTSVLAFYSQFNLGVGLFDATINNQLPDSRFFSWRGQGQYVRALNQKRDMLLLLRSDWQLATETLVPLEQFSVGGISSVRGYRQDALLTDNGVVVTAEVQLPVWRLSKNESVLSVIPFADFGVGWNSDHTVKLNTNTLMGSGLGLQWQTGQLKARIDWGIPLIHVKSQDRTWQESGLYFSVESRL